MSTTNEQRLREALTELLAHCGERGWWMKSPAIAVIDKAHAALSEPARPAQLTNHVQTPYLQVVGSRRVRKIREVHPVQSAVPNTRMQALWKMVMTS